MQERRGKECRFLLAFFVGASAFASIVSGETWESWEDESLELICEQSGAICAALKQILEWQCGPFPSSFLYCRMTVLGLAGLLRMW